MTGDGVALFVKESSLFSVTYLIKPPQKCRIGFHVFSCFQKHKTKENVLSSYVGYQYILNVNLFLFVWSCWCACVLRLQYKILSPFLFWAGRGGFIPYLYSYKIPSLVQIAATKYVGILPYVVHKLTFSNAFKYPALFYNDFLHVTVSQVQKQF